MFSLFSLLASRKFKFCCLIFIFGFFHSPPLFGQQEEQSRSEEWQARRGKKSASLESYKPGSLEKGISTVQSKKLLEKLAAGWKGFHPSFGGLPTGGGFAGGFNFLAPAPEAPTSFRVTGLISTKFYQHYETALEMKPFRGRLVLGLNGAYARHTQESFFGRGADSSKEDRSNFNLETSNYEARAKIRWTRWFDTGVSGGYLRTNTGPGTSPLYPKTEELFGLDLPGIQQQPDYLFGGLQFDVDYRDVPGNSHKGGYYTVQAYQYCDRKLHRYSFRRLHMEVQQYIPFFKGKRVIAFRGVTSLSDTREGIEMPFFMMETIGGSESMRGYYEYRFRDRSLLLFNLEYRWEIFSGLDMAIFGDAGKVAARRAISRRGQQVHSRRTPGGNPVLRHPSG